MSPTSFAPGASAWKSRATRSGTGRRRRRRWWWAGTGGAGRGQAQLTHDRADQLRGEALALTMQGGVDPAVPVGVIGVVEDPLDEGGQPVPAPAGRRRGPVAPLVEARGGHAHRRAHFHDRYGAFSASMNANFALTDTPGRRRPQLFPGTRPSSSARASLVRARVAGRGPRSTAAGSSPAWSSRYLWTQLPRVPSFTGFRGDLGDRPRRLDHHLHGLVFELRRELPTPFSHRSSSVPGPDLIGSGIRNLGGSPG